MVQHWIFQILPGQWESGSEFSDPGSWDASAKIMWWLPSNQISLESWFNTRLHNEIRMFSFVFAQKYKPSIPPLERCRVVLHVNREARSRTKDGVRLCAIWQSCAFQWICLICSHSVTCGSDDNSNSDAPRQDWARRSLHLIKSAVLKSLGKQRIAFH